MRAAGAASPSESRAIPATKWRNQTAEGDAPSPLRVQPRRNLLIHWQPIHPCLLFGGHAKGICTIARACAQGRRQRPVPTARIVRQPSANDPPPASRCAVPACANLPCRRSHPLDRGGSVYRMGSGASSDNIVLLSEQGSEIIADATKGSNLESAACLRESTDRPDAPRSVSGGGGHGSGAVSDAPELRATAPADEDTSGRTARTISIEAPRLWNENDEAFQGAARHSLRQPAPDSPQPYTGRYRPFSGLSIAGCAAVAVGMAHLLSAGCRAPARPSRCSQPLCNVLTCSRTFC